MLLFWSGLVISSYNTRAYTNYEKIESYRSLDKKIPRPRGIRGHMLRKEE